MDLEKVEFKGEKRFLSNMFVAPIVFDFNINCGDKIINGDGLTYKSSEHLYQALKSESKDWMAIIRNIYIPEKTKSFAKKHLVESYFESDLIQFLIRKDWDTIKLPIMEKIVEEKFKQNPELMKLLIDINGDIEERNCWDDTFWGTVDGIGQNNLGKILMNIRDKGENK